MNFNMSTEQLHRAQTNGARKTNGRRVKGWREIEREKLTKAKTKAEDKHNKFPIYEWATLDFALTSIARKASDD